MVRPHLSLHRTSLCWTRQQLLNAARIALSASQHEWRGLTRTRAGPRYAGPLQQPSGTTTISQFAPPRDAEV
eukprot:8088271-Pyramimonas_sp.AAC.1